MSKKIKKIFLRHTKDAYRNLETFAQEKNSNIFS